MRVYFKRIFVSGLINFPKDKPVILAVNHPNSVIDAMLCGIFLPKPVHFLARGDAFKSKGLSWFLTKLRIIPIFRKSEGNLDKNDATFDRCSEILNQKGVVLIFPEGICVSEKRLRFPLKKGLARIAFGSIESSPEQDLQVVPVGLNYTYFHKFRKEVMIDVGAPVPLEEYVESYRKAPAKGIRELTNQVATSMMEVNLIIDSPEREAVAEQALRLYRSTLDYGPGWKREDRSRLATEKYICEQVNKKPESELAIFEKKLTDFQETIKPFQLNMISFNNVNHGGFLQWFKLIMLLPFAVIGYLFRWPAVQLTKNMIKNKVKEKEFYATISVVGGILWFLVLTLILLLIPIFLPWYAYAAVTLILLSMFLSVLFDDQLEKIRQAIRWNKTKKKPIFRVISSMYKDLTEFLDDYMPFKPLA